MKKVKLLSSILALGTVAGTIVPLATSCSDTKVNVKINTSTGLSAEVVQAKLNETLIIHFTIEDGFTFDRSALSVIVGGTTLKDDDIYYIGLDNPEEEIYKICVKATSITSKDIEVNMSAIGDMESITVTPPTKTSYLEEEKLDITGMVVTANRKGEQHETIDPSKCTFSPSLDTPLTTDMKEVKVTYNGFEAKFAITVTQTAIKVTSITVNGGEGKQFTKGTTDIPALSTKVLPEDATDKSVTWSSSDPTKISIDADTGKMQALEVTDTDVTITATAKDGSGVKGTCAISVVEEATSLKLKNMLDIKLDDGETKTAKISATVGSGNAAEYVIEWSIIEGDDVATIEGATKTASGEEITVKGNKLGVATLQASCGGKTATCTVSTGYKENVIADPTTGNVYNNVAGITGTSTGNITAKLLSGTGGDLDIPRNEFNMPVVIDKDATSAPRFLEGCTSFNSEIVIPETMTQTGIYFMNGCSSFNQKIELPEGMTEISNYFMQGCSSFNQELTLPSTLTSVCSYFMNGCKAFNQDLTIPEGVTKILDNFMASCTSFNGELTLPDSLTSIGTYFLNGCKAFNQDLTIPSGISAISGYFMYQCSAFNSTLTLPDNLQTIGYSFMQECTSFNQELTIPSGVTTILENFMNGCKAFNQEIVLPDTLTSLGSDFMNGCSSFNNGSDGTEEKPLKVPDGITKISSKFLFKCTVFNQEVVLPDSCTEIEYCFMQDCDAFNKTITFPTGLTKIGAGFLYDCDAFNQEVNLPEGLLTIGDTFLISNDKFNNGGKAFALPSTVTSIGAYFFSNCVAFNQELTLPSSLTSLGSMFMNNCNKFNNGSDGSTSKPFAIPNDVTTINNYFMQTCQAFNQELTLPSNLTIIGKYFMSGCAAFNKPITIPSGVTSIGENFLSGASSFASTIDLSAVTLANLTIDGTTMMSGIPQSNTIVFKVASGTTSDWQTKLLTATGKSTWPSAWTFTEV